MRQRPTTYKIVWRDILIVIRHELDYLWKGTSHIEIHAVRGRPRDLRHRLARRRSKIKDLEEPGIQAPPRRPVRLNFYFRRSSGSLSPP